MRGKVESQPPPSPPHPQLPQPSPPQQQLPPPPPPLPNDIINNILLRLPVKSVARFRCVSREWNNLSTSTEFLHNYLECDRNRLMMVTYYNSHISINLKEPTNFVTTNHDFPFKENVYVIVGSCNGLLCMHVGHDYFIWNPSTGKYKQLPNKNHYATSFFYGFGYNKSIDGYYDYKVVRGERGETNPRGSEVELYSQRTNSWRKIQGFPYSVTVTARGIFVNGFLHWIGTRRENRTVSVFIASLDLEKEEFGEVMGPDNDYSRFSSAQLGVLNGMLCMTCSNKSRGWPTRDVYVMKEYGLWMVLITISNTIWPRPPVYMMNNGEFVLQTSRTKMMIRDPKHERDKELIDTGNVELIKSIVYLESFESP